MLPPDYLQAKAREIEELYSHLNEDITMDICRRIVKTGRVTETAAWQAMQVQESGVLMEDIVKQVSDATKLDQKTVAQMFNEAGVEAIKNDVAPLVAAGIKVDGGLSPAMMNILAGNLKKTNGEMLNLAMTTASTGQARFINLMNEAVMKVESGAFSYEEAIRHAINQCTSVGAKVLYETGEMSLESAARMNILTAVSQTAAAITEMNADDMGAEYYETSAHAGARPDHQEWQGQVFKRYGSSLQYDNFYDVTGYGNVDGLCGANCRHSFFPYWIGISKPAYTKKKLEELDRKSFRWNGVMYSEYEASQIMRRYERAVRDSKRSMAGINEAISASKDEALTRELKSALRQSKQTYDARRYRLLDFCKETGMKRDYLRTKTAVSK